MGARGINERLVETQAENTRLREDLAHTRAELAAARQELAAIRAHAAAQTTQLQKLTEQVAKGNERIAELLAIAKRKKKPEPKDKKEPAPQPPPGLTKDQQTAFQQRPEPPPAPLPLYDHPRPKQKPTGRRPLPEHLDADESTVLPERCDCGCTQFELVDEVCEQKLDVRSHQRKRVTHRKTGRCRNCGSRVTGEAPPAPFERSKVTCEWLAWLVFQKFQLLVPLDRIARYLGAQGVVLSTSFLVSQIEVAADILDAIDGEHWKQLLAGSWMGTDGTGLKVKVPEVGLHHGYLEVYHRDEIVLFHYEAEKGGETQADKLTKFSGTLLVDAESRYNETSRRHPQILEANCNAHPRRKLKDALNVQPLLAEEAGRFVSKMFELEALGRADGLTGEALKDWRLAEIKPITERFRAWIDGVLPTLLPNDGLAKVLKYYVRHWTELMRFLGDPQIPIDNSASEREFQHVAKWRLNCLFAGGTEGAHRAAVLLGLAATCRRLSVDFEAYLTWVFVRRGTHRHKYDLTAAQLTPAAYKASLAAAAA